VECDSKPVHGLTDVSSKSDCELYLKTVTQTITEYKQRFPDAEAHLLLSGGRKSMAALNLFAAQYAALSRVWHTLVKDPKFERRIEDELLSAPNPTMRRDILFLRRYTPENFDLFPVPIFTIQKPL
jgi:hypothetical protein